jgi:hypothetical protein
MVFKNFVALLLKKIEFKVLACPENRFSNPDSVTVLIKIFRPSKIYPSHGPVPFKEAAERAGTRQTFGLENRRKSSNIFNDDICSLSSVFLIYGIQQHTQCTLQSIHRALLYIGKES